MEMNHQTSGCPGLKLGHNKKAASSTVTTPIAHDKGNTEATAKKRGSTSKQIAESKNNSHNARRKFKLPGYQFQATKLNRLPASPHTLFKKEQLLGMLEDFARHMYDAITTNDIHVPPSIKIGLNATGDIKVLGHHPDQGKIEALFGNNSPLNLQLHQIAFTSRVQQLADLQPGFKGDFFKFPAHSIQQISFVHMRAIKLSPFSMTIDQPGNTANPAVVHQGQTEVFSYFHMMITRTRGFTSLPSTTTQQAVPTPNTNDHTLAKPEKPEQAKPWKAAIRPITTNQEHMHKEKDSEVTLDAPNKPIANQAEHHKRGKPHHVHKGRLRCIINS